MFKGFLDKYVLAGDVASSSAAPVAVNTAPMGSAPSITVNNNEFVTALRNAIKARTSAFTALLQAADKLMNIIPDPNTRLKAAFASVSGEGRGLREVLGAIDVHVADLESQKMQFQHAMEAQKQTALGTLQNELSAIAPANESAQQQIAAMNQQIQQLQQMMATNNQRALELNGQISAEGARFTATTQQFESAMLTVRSELDGQRVAIASTLS